MTMMGLIGEKSAAVAGDTTTGLVSFWPMNEGGGSGTTMHDTVSGHDVTVSSSSLWQAGYIAFNAVDTAQAANITAWRTAPLTVFGWVNTFAGQASVAIFSCYDFGGTNNRCWGVYVSPTGSSNTMRCLISDTGASFNGKAYEGSQILCDNTWHSFAMRVASGLTLDLFIDGVKDSSPVKTVDTAITSLFATTSPLGIACQMNGAAPDVGTVFGGGLQQFRFYNIAKSDADILAIHNLGHA